MKKWNIILLIIFIVNISPTKAQTNFKEGYIIKCDGDTLKGFIKSKSQKSMGKICLFKENKEANIVKYSPNDIKSYRFLNGKYYTSKKVNLNDTLQNIFLEFLINGKADLFTYKDKDNIHFYIQNEGDTLVELNNSIIGFYIEDSYYEREKKEYIGLLKITFNDFPAIHPDVENTKFDHRQLINLTKKYHNFVCNDYECVVYKKDTKAKFSIGLMAGSTYSTLSFNAKDNMFLFLEQEKFLWKPTTSVYLLLSQKNLFGFHERLSFNLNIGYLKNKYESENISIYQENLNIPIYFEYNFFNGKFSPTISFGINNSLKLSTKITEENYSELIEPTIGSYQISGFVGLGAEYSQGKFTYLIKSNYEIGSSINKDGFLGLNYISSQTRGIGIHFGFKYAVGK